MFRLLRHIVQSSLQTTQPLATFMLLPHWRSFSCNAYKSWLYHYPDLAKVLAKFPTYLATAGAVHALACTCGSFLLVVTTQQRRAAASSSGSSVGVGVG
eukprot:77646-Pelagomonas_calceolata.AAC.1